MALASPVARLREVLLSGSGTRRTFSTNLCTITMPAGADGVVLYPEPDEVPGPSLVLRGFISDTGLSLSKVAPSIICTTDASFLLFNLGGRSIIAKFFRLQ